jgi:mRNA interferase RelE/StbE
MTWQLLVTKPARKELEKLPTRDRVRITQALTLLEDDPFRGDIKRLEPSGWRRRVGNYRIFFDLDVATRHIVVTAILRRTSTTY